MVGGRGPTAQLSLGSNQAPVVCALLRGEFSDVAPLIERLLAAFLAVGTFIFGVNQRGSR